VSLGEIVVVEDEPAIRGGIMAALSAAGYTPTETSDGEAGLTAARRNGVDLVLLDLMLPKLDGMSVLRKLRQTHPTLPVIILTARGAEDERVSGLKAGADDYIVKPFSARELIARVEAVMRRSPERPVKVARLNVGKGSADLERRELRRDDQRISLSETECSILCHLAENSGRAISRDELLTRVWGLSSGGVETRTIDMHVARLRAKLEEISGQEAAEFILTVRGKGYMLGDGVKPGGKAGPG
jgi:DNA-binding response OmpR family regulator